MLGSMILSSDRCGFFLYVSLIIVVIVDSASIAKENNNINGSRSSRGYRSGLCQQDENIGKGAFWEFGKGQLKLTARLNVNGVKQGILSLIRYLNICSY